MFIEVTSKDKPLYVRLGDIMAVCVDGKNAVTLVTDSLGGVVIKESYDEIKTRIADAETRMFPHRYKSGESKN